MVRLYPRRVRNGRATLREAAHVLAGVVQGALAAALGSKSIEQAEAPA
jgi:hypothetical protein